MNLEERSWRAALTSAKASVYATVLAALTLLLSVLAYVDPPESSTPVVNPLANNSGMGTVFIQGSGNTVITAASDLTTPDVPTPALVGTWRGLTVCETASGGLVASGYTRLLETGQYNYSGDISFRSSDGVELQFSAAAAGTWKSLGGKFVLTALEIKTQPRFLRQPGEPPIDLTNPLKIPIHLPKLEDLMPRGASQEYAILELGSSRLRAQGTDLRGNLVTYQATRQ